MTDKFEQSIIDWYDKAQTRNLEYLNLSIPTPEVLANNIGVVYNKTCLLSKVSLKHFYILQDQNQKLQEEVARLRVSVTSLEKEFVRYRPLTKQDISVACTSKQTEEKALVELRSELKTIKRTLAEIKGLISG